MYTQLASYMWQIVWKALGGPWQVYKYTMARDNSVHNPERHVIKPWVETEMQRNETESVRAW